MKNFQSVIYSISGGVSRGKASSIDPFDIVELRNFSTLVFSNGEPPMLSQNSFAGETVRPMAWGAYMLRSSVVSVFIRLGVKARENPFRFEMISERWKFLVTFIWIMEFFLKTNANVDME